MEFDFQKFILCIFYLLALQILLYFGSILTLSQNPKVKTGLILYSLLIMFIIIYIQMKGRVKNV